MDDYAQYSNMMNQLNSINQAGREIVNEKKEDQQEKLNEYKKTLEMTTEGIGGGILHDTGISLIKKGFAALKNKVPVPAEELENMLNDYKEGGAKKMFEGMTKRGYQKAKSKMFGDDDDAETSVKKVFGKLFQSGKAQSPSTVGTKPEENLTEATEPNFDSVTSNDEYKTQNKLLKDKVKSLDPDTQKRIQTDLNNDSTIKKPSELKTITDPEEKLAERVKRGNALNDRINTEIENQQSVAQKSKTTLSRLEPVQGEEAETDAADTGGKSLVSRLFNKAKATIDPSLEDDEEDSGILQKPKQLGGKILQSFGEEEEEGAGFGSLLGGVDKIAQAGLLGSQLFKKGETGKQREQLLGSTAKQTVIDNVKDEATSQLSSAVQGAGKDAIEDTVESGAKDAVEDTVDDTVKDVAKKAGTRVAETDVELGGPEDPFGDVISGLVGLGTLLGGIFGAKKKHLPPTPAYVPINPTFQSGA